MSDATPLVLDADHPWPGLESYGEANSDFFKGREEEKEALLRLVERETLSVLYGRSGLGKTSLVQAGLFPRLRQLDYLPIRIHLLLTDDAASLRRQIGNAIAQACTEHSVEGPAYEGDVSLWEFFYTEKCEFWSAADRLLKPLLIFDQFEEIFTLGREAPERRERCEALLVELGELVENRRPPDVRKRIEAEPELAARFNSRRSPPKVLLSFREDYLADFEGLDDYLRGRTSNRLRLLPMKGSQAEAAIVAACPERLKKGVAAQIVRFIDERERPLAELVVEPALLSLVCQKLNERRIERKQEQISADLLRDGSAKKILEKFYEDAFVGLDPRVRHFVEDRLLTIPGHRDSCSLDNALVTPGVNEAALQTLSNRRLLGRESRDGRVRLELIHDVLAPVAKVSRDLRREREERLAFRRRQLRRNAIFLLVMLVVASFAAFTLWQARKVSEQVSLVLVDYARKAIEVGRPELAARLAILAARESLADVADPLAAPTLAAAAQHSSLLLEIRTQDKETAFSPDRQRFLTWSWDGPIRVWDAASGAKITSVNHEKVLHAMFDASGERFLSWSFVDGTVHVWNAATGATIASSKHEERVNGAKFDSSGERVLSWSSDGVVRIWNATTGATIASSKHEEQVWGAVFDSPGERVLFWSRDGVARIWNATTGATISSSKHEKAVLSAVFDSSGERVLSWSIDGVVRIWNAMTGATIEQSRYEGSVSGARSDLSGEHVLFWSNSGVTRIWNATTGATIASARHERPVLGAVFDSSGERVLSWSRDGVARIWNATTGATIAESKHEEAFRGAVFDSTGERVWSWTADGVLRLWYVAPAIKLGKAADYLVFDEKGVQVLAWNSTIGSVRILDARSGADIAELKHEGKIRIAKFDVTGQRVLTVDEGGVVQVWNSKTGAKMAASQDRVRVYRTGFDPSGDRVLAWGEDGFGRIWDVGTGAELMVLKSEGKIEGYEFAATGKRVLAWGEAGSARIWDTATGAEIVALKADGASFDPTGESAVFWGHGMVRVWRALPGFGIESLAFPSVTGACFDASGKQVLSWSSSGAAQIWKVAAGPEKVTVIFRYGIQEAKFDASGERVLFWDGTSLFSRLRESETVRVCEVGTGADIAISKHRSSVNGAIFDVSGKRVLSWDVDGIARVWDAATGIELAAMHHGGPVKTAMFDAAGKRVLSWAPGEGFARNWDVSWTVPRSSNRELIDDVCERKLRGPDTPLLEPFVNGKGDTITHDSVRRLSAADVEFAPILRGRVGEDVCAPPPWYQEVSERLAALFR